MLDIPWLSLIDILQLAPFSKCFLRRRRTWGGGGEYLSTTSSDPHTATCFHPLHVIRQSMQFLLSRENYSLFLFLFIHKNIPWMVIQLIASFGIWHSSSFYLAGLIQPILSMIYFEKDQNAQNLTQSNKCTTGTNSFYGEKRDTRNVLKTVHVLILLYFRS